MSMKPAETEIERRDGLVPLRSLRDNGPGSGRRPRTAETTHELQDLNSLFSPHRTASGGGKPIRICLVDSHLQTGGAEWSATQLTLMANPAIFEFVAATWRSQDSPLAERLRQNGITVTDASTWRSNGVSYSEWKEDVLFEQLDRLRPDILFFSAQYLFDELSHERLAGLPTVVRISNFHREQMKQADFSSAAKVICTTAEQFEAVPEAHADKAQVIGTGVDTDLFRPLAAREKEALKREHGFDGKTVVLFVARLGDPLKRTPVFQDVVRAVQASRDDVAFLVVGYFEHHNNDNEEEFRQFVAEHDVVWKEHLAPWEMPGIYQMADILISTSAAHEGLSNTVLQALSAEVVPVVTGSAGMHELVEPGVTGFLVDQSDASTIERQLLDAVDLDDETRTRLKEAGRRKVEERFSLTDSAAAYQQAFLELFRRQPAKVCITDGYFGTGGAEWLAALLILNSDPAEVTFELVMHQKGAALEQWLEAHGVPAHEAPTAASYSNWIEEGMEQTFKALRPDIVMPCTITTWPAHEPFYRLLIISQNASDAANLTTEQYDQADYFLCVSDDVKQHLSAEHQWKMRVLHNSIDVEMFAPDRAVKARVRGELGVAEDAVVVLWCGRLHEARKRPDVLRDVIAATDDPRVHFMVVGYFRGDEGDQEGWRQFVDSHPNLTWVDEVPPWETPDYYRAADIYLSTSGFKRSDFEGLSVATVQALATSLPVVTTMSGGQQEVVEDGVNGRLVETGDVQGLVKAILEVVGAEPTALDAMRQASREKALADFDIRRHAELYARITRLMKNSVGPALAADPDPARRAQSFRDYTWPLLREADPENAEELLVGPVTPTQLVDAAAALDPGGRLVVQGLVDDPDAIHAVLDHLQAAFPIWSSCERRERDLILQKR
jgi:glycosyltransferase involved in cell wall biosynthesis